MTTPTTDAIAELREAADVLSEAAVEITNAYGPGNVVAGRCRELVRKIDGRILCEFPEATHAQA